MLRNGGDRRGNPEIRSRVVVLMILISISFAFYTAYLFSLQIVNGSEYRRRAEEVARREAPISAQRGEIYDRNYDVPLVMNIDSFAVDIIPGELTEEELPLIAEKLSPIINMPAEDILEKIPEAYYHLFQPIEIRGGISFQTIARISERLEEFPGVTWHNKPIRSYLETGSIAHVIGYVGDITREELQVLYNRGYGVQTSLGKDGIEREFDEILRGKEGKRFRKVDVRGRRIDTDDIEEIPPELGKNLVLTIDRNIQELCEKALGERIGSVVVLKPHTGEVLAMVSYPWYNPNDFYEDDGGEEFTRLSLDPKFPFLNRAIQSSYPPASTFKVLLTTAVLEEELFPTDQEVVCEGSIFYGDRIFNCHKKTGHGPLALMEGLAESCDVYFYTLGTEALGIDVIVDYSRRFGFGQISGVDLPGEVPGLVPSPQWKESVYNATWLGGDTINISIGQGYLTTTPIQVANMISMVVNDGTIYKPHLVKEIRDPISGKIIESIEPAILHSSSIRQSTFDKVKEGMRGVITDGTAKVVLTTDAVEVAGKTGTGEVGYADRWHSWFAAYGPYNAENPEDQVVVVTMVEAANEWEWWAPKAANIIFQGIFADQTFAEAVEDLNLWYLLRE